MAVTVTLLPDFRIVAKDLKKILVFRHVSCLFSWLLPRTRQSELPRRRDLEHWTERSGALDAWPPTEMGEGDRNRRRNEGVVRALFTDSLRSHNHHVCSLCLHFGICTSLLHTRIECQRNRWTLRGNNVVSYHEPSSIEVYRGLQPQRNRVGELGRLHRFQECGRPVDGRFAKRHRWLHTHVLQMNKSDHVLRCEGRHCALPRCENVCSPVLCV